MEGGSYCVRHYLLNLHNDIPFHINVFIGVSKREIFLELLVTEFVARFILAVIFRIFLDCIID
jgi:hypothetical protein